MNKRGACGLDFGSLTAFDRHRVGRHEPLERRCLTLEELELAGFVRNHFGRLSIGGHLERGRARRGARAGAAND